MGHKYVVPYGLYGAKGYVSPTFAERTHFTQADLELLFEALVQMFEHDRSAARGEMIVRGIYDFEHIGTQGPSNADQNRREARLGCAHSHKLFETVNVTLAKDKEFPQAFGDYNVTLNGWQPANGDLAHASFPGVRAAIGPGRSRQCRGSICCCRIWMLAYSAARQRGKSSN